MRPAVLRSAVGFQGSIPFLGTLDRKTLEKQDRRGKEGQVSTTSSFLLHHAIVWDMAVCGTHPALVRRLLTGTQEETLAGQSEAWATCLRS